MTKNLTQGTPWKSILLFALPIMAGNLLQQLYSTSDTIIVGRFVSEQAMSAVGACTSLTLLFTALAIGFSVGAGVLIAQYYGAGLYEELQKYASTAVVLMLGMGLAASLIGVGSARFLLQTAMGTPASLQQQAVLFFRIYAAGLVFQFGYNVVAAILRAIGDSKATLYFLLVSSVLNIILDLIFVAGLHWGVAGAGFATLISQLCSCVTAFFYMYSKHEMLRFGLKGLRFDRIAAKRILQAGAPMAIQQSLVSCGFVFLQKLVNSYAEAMVASYTVACRMEAVLQVPIIGIQNTMATYAGQNMGARKPERVSRGLGQGVLLSTGMSLILCVSLYILAPQVIALFGLNGDAAAFCLQHLRAVTFSYMFFAFYFPANGMFQGAGEGFYATFCAVLALGLRVAFAYMLQTVPLFGYTAIWWSQLMAWFITLVVCYSHYFRGTWKTKSLIR